MMKKMLIATTALALVAGTVAMPSKTDAHVWWLWPALIAGGSGVVVGGAAVAAADSQYGYYGPRGDIIVRPTSTCHLVRERGADGYWHQVEVCG